MGLEAARAGIEDDSVCINLISILVLASPKEAGRERRLGWAGPLELMLLGLARATRWVRQLDWVGGIEESVCFGVALAECYIADLVIGGFGRRGVVGGDFSLNVLVVAHQFRHPQRPGFINCMNDSVSMVK